MRHRSPILPVREVLSRRMKELGLSAYDVEQRAFAHGYRVDRNTINGIVSGDTKKPRLDIVVAIAMGLDEKPLSLIAEMLGISADDPGIQNETIRLIWETYRSLTPSQQTKANPFIDGLILQLRHIKNLLK